MNNNYWEGLYITKNCGEKDNKNKNSKGDISIPFCLYQLSIF